MSWNLEDLKSLLRSRKELKGWIISQEHTHRMERYFVGAGSSVEIDQDREVHARNLFVRLMVRLDGKPHRQGEITKQLFPALALEPQILGALDAAARTDLEAWELPAKLQDELPALKSADPKISENLPGAVDQLSAQIRTSAPKFQSKSRFNSAELFVSLHDREVHLSTGLTHRTSQTRVYTEAAYSTEIDEYLSTQWSIALDDLKVDALFQDASRRAEATLELVKPKPGSYCVLIDAEALALMVSECMSQLSGTHKYMGLPFKAPGEPLIAEARRDLLTVALDPTLDFGADTLALSDDGTRQRKLDLVRANQVLASLVGKQYSDYLRTEPTTTRGNWVVAPGKHSHSELLKLEPETLEILQFSALFGDPNQGTYSSEIKLGRLHDRATGKVTYVKGGSVSMNFFEHFRDLSLSSETLKRSHFEPAPAFGLSGGVGYFGPRYALLRGVSVAG
jgi:predicted Zn-dependent protease